MRRLFGPAPAPVVQMLRVGEAAWVDPMAVTGLYKKDNRVVVRIGGMGVIELAREDLFANVNQTVLLIASAVAKYRELCHAS